MAGNSYLGKVRWASYGTDTVGMKMPTVDMRDRIYCRAMLCFSDDGLDDAKCKEIVDECTKYLVEDGWHGIVTVANKDASSAARTTVAISDIQEKYQIGVS